MRVTSTELASIDLDADTITNLYLYGSLTPPDRLFDRIKTEAYLNMLPTITFDGSQVSVVDINVDAAEFLSSGAGRFASLAANDVIRRFFEAPDFLLPADVSESFSDMASRLDLVANGFSTEPIFSIEHLFQEDSIDDTPDRPYVFGNSSFTVRIAIRKSRPSIGVGQRQLRPA